MRDGYYIWHTAKDNKVRSSHADREGKIYAWNDPPEGGHPGQAPNCRCWAEKVAGKKKTCSRLRVQLQNYRLNVQDAQIQLSEVYAQINQLVNERKILENKLNENRFGALGDLASSAMGFNKKGMILGGLQTTIDRGVTSHNLITEINKKNTEIDGNKRLIDYFYKQIKTYKSLIKETQTKIDQCN